MTSQHTQCFCKDSSTFSYDKSKICDILHNGYYNHGKKVIYSGINKPDKVFKHVPGCYLNDPPVKKPFLNLNHKIFKDVPIHGVRRLINNIKDVETQTSLKDSSDLNYTERREDYELNKLNLGSKLNLESNSSSITMSKFISSESLEDLDLSKKLKEIDSFRKENYFDTHQLNETPSHKCEHRFRINERFLSEPINSDPYGNSRCVICNKTLVNSGKISSSYSPVKSKKEIGNVKKRYELMVKPQTVNIGSGKEIMRISVPFQLGDEYFKRDLKYKKGCVDSFALRYQKGVI